MARLSAHVHVRDEFGAVHVFGPDDVVPEWAVDAISNPDAWEPEESEPEPEPESEAPAKGAAKM